MWRTVLVSNGEKITVHQGWFVVYSEELESRVPLDDIYAVMIDNRACTISVSAITALSSVGAAVYFCNDKHIPYSVSLPLHLHCKPYGVLKKQMAMTQDFKDELWKRVVTAKITNQIKCLQIQGVQKEKLEPIEALLTGIQPGDKTGREARAAKLYFPALFGVGFFRYLDNVTNDALNYGYTVLRSSIAKTLVAYGYNGAFGIHHINESDPFNLADDFMEPFRPLVDLWVDENCDELLNALSRQNRKQLANLVNVPIKMNGKKMRVRYAIDQYISSFTSAIQSNDATKLIMPELIGLETEFEDDLDG